MMYETISDNINGFEFSFMFFSSIIKFKDYYYRIRKHNLTTSLLHIFL